MAAQITTLIDKKDGAEIVRDQIAGILLLEVAEQQRLAQLVGKDPAAWKLNVYLERSNPWGAFLEEAQVGKPPPDNCPIVNVAFDRTDFAMAKGNTVSRQTGTGKFNIDCYAHALSALRGASEHSAGDELAALEAQRVARLVRNILMAGHYTYLGLRGTVGRRWLDSAQALGPPSDIASLQHVEAVRLVLTVDFDETSPQVEGEILETIGVTVKRDSDGRVYLTADFPTTV